MPVGPLPPVIGEVPLTGGHGRPAARDGAEAGRPQAAPSVPPVQPAPAPAPPPALTALDRIVAAALMRQDGVSALFPAVAALRATPDLPPALAALLERIAAMPLKSGADAAAVRAAMHRFGIFHEAMDLAGDPAAPADLKSVLRHLRDALLAHHAGRISAAPAERGRERTPPPRAGMPPPPDPALPPEASDDAGALAERLFRRAEEALSRIALHQAVVIEDSPDAGETSRARALGLEVPLAGPAGVSMAAVRIERDEGSGGGEGPAEPVFRVAIAFDLAPLGPVEARIGLLPGRRLAIGLWCEAEAALAPVEAELPALRQALEAAGLEVAAVDLRHGRAPRPPPPAAPPVHRVDLAL